MKVTTLAPVGLALILLLTPAGTAMAADDEEKKDRDEPKVEELERKVDVLAEEIERLRAGEGETSRSAATEDDEPLRLGLGPSASKVYGVSRGVSLGGYGEWLYQGPDGSLDDGTPSGAMKTADQLRFVLYTGYKFTDSILLNTEVEFEHGTTDDEGEVSVEFAYLDFLIRPELNVRTGLVLVPVGLINETHEPTTFLGSRRPDVETSILPSTWRELGAGVFGDVGPVSYRAFLTTSLDAAGFTADRGIRGGRQNGSEAVAEDLALSARVDYAGIPGLLVGVSGFRGDSGQGQTVMGNTVAGTVTTTDVHADYRWRALETRGVWARVEIDDAEAISALTGETIGSTLRGWYLQAGYDVLAPTRFNSKQLIPFVRVESFDTQSSVPAALASTVTGVNDRDVTTFGVVFRPIPQVAIKVDRQNDDNAAGTGLDQTNVAVGFSF